MSAQRERVDAAVREGMRRQMEKAAYMARLLSRAVKKWREARDGRGEQ